MVLGFLGDSQADGGRAERIDKEEPR